MAMISNRANDTPVQSQSERAAFFVCEPSQAMRAADREPTGGEIPVELRPAAVRFLPLLWF